jgi:hypothetical protein
MAAAAQIAGEERLTSGNFYPSVLSKQAVEALSSPTCDTRRLASFPRMRMSCRFSA